MPCLIYRQYFFVEDGESGLDPANGRLLRLLTPGPNPSIVAAAAMGRLASPAGSTHGFPFSSSFARRRFAGRRVMHFIDNTVAQSALVHGYARTDDLADISNGFHLMAAGLRTAAYFDYVPSKANIADLPSRGEFALPRALGADVVPMRVPGRAMLEGPLEAWIDFGEQHGADKDWPT